MADDYQQLKERLTKLSDEELIEIVLAAPGEYRKEAREIAEKELKWRRVDIPQAEGPQAAVSDPVFPSPPQARPGNVCVACGGSLRPGTLVAEKELTIVFSDSQEERFVKVIACSRCGLLALVADLDTI